MEQALFTIARQSYRDPREGAVSLLSLGVPREAIWPGFGVIVMLSVLLSGMGDVVAPPPPEVSVSYFAMTIVLATVFLAYAAAIWRIGAALGGKGSFEESLLLGVFFQAILLPAQVLQLILVIAMPAIAGIYAIGLLLLGLWINLNFIDALHGFASLGKSLGVLLLSSLAAALALMLTLTILGQSLGTSL